jgi:hypothetical protein
MGSFFAIEADFSYDDGEVCYTLEIRNRNFQAQTISWGSDREYLEFASALEGFPRSNDAELRHCFGLPGAGTCELSFNCSNQRGYVGLWATLESETPAGRGDKFERASLFIECEPAAIDTFAATLRRFGAGSINRAELLGLDP